jgi:uncharacterized integral membrane protein
MRWKLYLSLILLTLVLTFVLQNTARVNFNFLFWTFGLPGALLLLVVFILGIVTGLLQVASKRTAQRKHPEKTVKSP